MSCIQPRKKNKKTNNFPFGSLTQDIVMRESLLNNREVLNIQSQGEFFDHCFSQRTAASKKKKEQKISKENEIPKEV